MPRSPQTRPRRTRPRRLGAAPLALIAALLAGALVACTGGEEASPTPTATPTPSPTPVVRAAPPQELRSYRYAVAVTVLPSVLDTSEAPSGLPLDEPVTITIEGERVNPDREHSITAIDLGFLALTTEAIRIGEQQWIREGDGVWDETAAGGLEVVAGLDFTPSTLFAGDVEEYEEIARRLEDHPWTEETLDGIPTRRFSFTQEEFYAIFQAQGDVLPAEVEADLSAELWLSADLGTPVRIVLVGTDAAGAEVMRLQLDLRDMNAPDIAVEPPI